jgi:hypothetical protein
MTYKKRLKAFLGQAMHRAEGFVSWYGATGSHVLEYEHVLTGETLRSLRTEGTRLPNPLTFGPSELAEYFKPGEDLPCFMRGSIYALRVKKDHQKEVFRRQIMRWVRKRKITALTMTEWEGMSYREFWKAKAERLKSRYGLGGRWSWLDELDGLVDATPDRPFVLIDGVRYEVEEEQLKALREMQSLDRKLRVAA